VSVVLNCLYTFISFDLCRVFYSFCFFSSDNEDPKKFVATAPIVDAPAIDEPPSQEAAVVPKSPDTAAKKAGSRASKRLKKTSAASTSLDAPRPITSTDDVSAMYFLLLASLELLFSCLALGRL
jgi:hypothetical protein